MNTETLWTRVKQRPFSPFRIKTSDGERYDVLHPEMILVSKTTVALSVYDRGEDPEEDVPARQVFLSPLHVTAVEDLPRRTNGSRRRK